MHLKGPSAVPQILTINQRLPELCAFQGGVPIKIGEEVISAIGVAGGSGEQDVEISLSAAEALHEL